MSLTNKLRIIIFGFDIASTEEVTKIISQQISQLKLKSSGPWPLPTKRRLYCVPISPHKHKDAQEQFERKTHRRALEIFDPKPADLIHLNKLILPRTVGVKIKEISAA